MKLKTDDFQIVIKDFIGGQVSDILKSFLSSCHFGVYTNEETKDKCWCILAPSFEVAEALDSLTSWRGYTLLAKLKISKICIYYNSGTEFPELSGVWEVHDVCI
ncbi:hypothetical protein Cri9333_1736 [Crinalium epipsammum PCC 9333]|uniref:Uncharacterized protein n=1 Tax=Crinalium epipsammum PCC 9333 TaxID=1173022 RepID=K9VXD9_9CYAN|nr:hypothetical protein [Crinalium epipsammum]AFZ12621.1 hypothetical protein Cri9333_1736 [Crinalium epipsammum PCC 9333]